MNLDYVDIFYSHRYDPETPLEETMQALDQIVRQGKALYVGISSYSPEYTVKAYEILKELGTPFIIHQPKYSLLVREIEEGLLPVLEEKGLGCIVFSPLAQGLLTDKYLDGIPSNSRAAKPHGFLRPSAITTELVNKLKQLNNLAIQRGQSLAQMSLSWVLKDKRITSVLVGASSVDQMDDNLKCLNNLNFADHELMEIERILNS
jgi:L-glyceraldehyde 3-phosphate reductase